MPAIPTVVSVDCPRCGDEVECTLRTVEVRHGDRHAPIENECHVPDLAEKLQEHYQEAHGWSPDAN